MELTPEARQRCFAVSDIFGGLYTTGTEVMQPYCNQVIPGVERSLPVIVSIPQNERRKMGLDIYLSRRIFIGAMYRSRAITGKIELFSCGKPIPVKLELLASVTEDIYHGSKTWWLWEWFNHEAPELIEANGLEHVISVDTLQKLCRACEEVLSAKGTEAFSALCGNQLHYPVRKEIAPDDLLNLVQEIEELVRVLKDIEQQPDIDFHLAVSW